MSRLSDLNALSSSTQHKVRRSLGNITDSAHAVGDNNQKRKRYQSNHFLCKEHLVKKNICTACNSTIGS